MIELRVELEGRSPTVFRTNRDVVSVGRRGDLQVEVGQVARLHVTLLQIVEQIWVLDHGSAGGSLIEGRGHAVRIEPFQRSRLEIGEALVLAQSCRLTLQASTRAWEGPAPTEPALTRVGPHHEECLVLSDWLEAQGRPREAEYARAVAAPPSDESRTRLRLATRWVTPEFRARFSNGPIEGCKTRAQCPGSWAALPSTDHPFRRACDRCEQEVFYCDSVYDGANRRRLRDDRVVIDPAEVRAPRDLD